MFPVTEVHPTVFTQHVLLIKQQIKTLSSTVNEESQRKENMFDEILAILYQNS